MFFIYLASCTTMVFYYLFIHNPIMTSIYEMFKFNEPFAAIVAVSSIAFMVILVTTFIPIVNTLLSVSVIYLCLRNRLHIAPYFKV